MVPVNVLVRDLAVHKSHDCNEGNLDPSASRFDTRQHPVDLARMGEFEKHLIDELVGADRAAYRRQFGVRWVASR